MAFARIFRGTSLGVRMEAAGMRGTPPNPKFFAKRAPPAVPRAKTFAPLCRGTSNEPLLPMNFHGKPQRTIRPGRAGLGA